jgi:hypothetical protein
MSIMRCDKCDRHIDTDFNVEGEFGIDGYDYICGGCLDEHDTEQETSDD